MSAASTGTRQAFLGAAVLAALAAGLTFFSGQPWAMALALGLNLASTAFVVGAISRALTGSATGFARGGLNRYSLSRLQMGVWTVAVVAILVTVAEWNLLAQRSAGVLNIQVPGALLAALGISLGSGVAAPAIVALRAASSAPATEGQVAAATERSTALTGHAALLVPQGQIVGNANAAGASWTDLFTGDDVANAGSVDLSKLQQALLTVIIVAAYLGSVLPLFAGSGAVNALPPMSEEMTLLLAISHAGYLAYKAVPKPDAAGGPR